MRDLAADKRLCEAAIYPHGDHTDSRTIMGLHNALGSALDELERLYAMLDKFPPIIVIRPDLLLKKFGTTWGVFHKGKAAASSPTLREALHRAWELEATK